MSIKGLFNVRISVAWKVLVEFQLASSEGRSWRWKDVGSPLSFETGAGEVPTALDEAAPWTIDTKRCI